MLKSAKWYKNLRLPLIAAPMFLVSGTDLVINACKQGIVGTFPALNARSEAILMEWLAKINTDLSSHQPRPVAPYGVNLIVHKTNKRLEGNLRCIVGHKVPIVITSLGAVKDIVSAVHDYGGIVLHDVTNVVHARKAIGAGVDGLIAVCSGAGGHSGEFSPFALIPQLRSEFDGIICLAGSLSDGRSVLAAQALGADMAYMGTRFIATKESMASQAYKQMILNSSVGPPPSFLPTVYTNKISGVHANFLRESLRKAGLDPDDPRGANLGIEDFSKINENKAWRDIWSAGHGCIVVKDIPSVEDLVSRMHCEYEAAKTQLIN